MTYSHAEWIANHRATWIAQLKAELAADGYRDHAAAIAHHAAGRAQSIVAMTGRGASS